MGGFLHFRGDRPGGGAQWHSSFHVGRTCPELTSMIGAERSFGLTLRHLLPLTNSQIAWYGAGSLLREHAPTSYCRRVRRGRDVFSNWKAEHLTLRSMTILLHPHATRLENVVPFLWSETHSEGRIGYREWARRNGRLGDIHSIDDRYGHHSTSLWPDLVYPT